MWTISGENRRTLLEIVKRLNNADSCELTFESRGAGEKLGTFVGRKAVGTVEIQRTSCPRVCIPSIQRFAWMLGPGAKKQIRYTVDLT